MKIKIIHNLVERSNSNPYRIFPNPVRKPFDGLVIKTYF